MQSVSRVTLRHTGDEWLCLKSEMQKTQYFEPHLRLAFMKYNIIKYVCVFVKKKKKSAGIHFKELKIALNNNISTMFCTCCC